MLKLDRGNIQQVISLSFPENTRFSTTKHELKPNPNLFTIRFGGLTLAYYYDSEKGFFYDCDGIYLERFEKHDLRNAFAQIGAILRGVRKQKG